MGYERRCEFYSKIGKMRGSTVICYVTGDRRQFETQIHEEVLSYFVKHLDEINAKKITLILYTIGGRTLAAWSLVNLLHQFCDELEIIVPMKAHSAGTLLCIGAQKIIMTKQATLGPIDPSLNSPLNPVVPGHSSSQTYPVNVEAIKGYIEFVKEEFGVENDLAKVVTALSEKVHPLVLGEVYRAKKQIQMLADKLLSKHLPEGEKEKKEKIISFLCSESGSHDYTINRTEAKEQLGLNIEKPDKELYSLIKSLFNDIEEELELFVTFKPDMIIGDNDQVDYKCTRAIIESDEAGSHRFITEGIIKRITKKEEDSVRFFRTAEGWMYEKSK